jgi:hypothetical protein
MSFRYSSGKGPETWDRPPWDRPPLQTLKAEVATRIQTASTTSIYEAQWARKTCGDGDDCRDGCDDHSPAHSRMPLTFPLVVGSSFFLVPSAPLAPAASLTARCAVQPVTHRLHSAPEARYAALMAELAELWYASSRLQAENETEGAT